MRWCSAIGVVALIGALAACGGDDPAPAKNRLVLELGGDGTAIREVLRRASPPGVAPEPAPESGSDTVSPTRGEIDIEPPPRAEPPVRPSTPAFRTVELPEGWTLIRLCEQHLGDRDRWAEVARLNGWSEADLTRLPAGTAVRLPIQ